MRGDIGPASSSRRGIDLADAGRKGSPVRARSRRPAQHAGSSRCGWISALLLFIATTHAHAACVAPGSLVHSTVSIARYFDDAEQHAQGDLLGIRGTGWFLSPTSIVTVGHVASAMRLSDQEWKDIEIMDGDIRQTLPARILRRAGSRSENMAVLELRGEIAGASILPTRMEPLLPDEAVVSLAYPAHQLRYASGRFVQYADSEQLAGMAMFELYDGDDRLVLDHGASGAPILDCDGRVVAAVSNLFTRTMRLLSNEVRISTPWGSANVVSVPVQVLKNFSQVQ
jgi:Trypsin-like peptidase domain